MFDRKFYDIKQKSDIMDFLNKKVFNQIELRIQISR